MMQLVAGSFGSASQYIWSEIWMPDSELKSNLSEENYSEVDGLNVNVYVVRAYT